MSARRTRRTAAVCHDECADTAFAHRTRANVWCRDPAPWRNTGGTMNRSAVLVIGLVLAGLAVRAQQRAGDQPFDLAPMESALAAGPQGADAEHLADRIRSAFGGREILMRGAPPKTNETPVMWALDLAELVPAGGIQPRVARDIGG